MSSTSICFIATVLVLFGRGTTNPHHEPTGKIVGGKTLDSPHSAPFMAALLDVELKQLFCGGTLITEKYVLTAARCLIKFTDIIVVLGAYDLTKEEDTQLRYEINESKFTIHPNYTQEETEPGLGLIELPKEVEENDYIKVAKLPDDRHKEVIFFDGKIYGWGRTEKGFSKFLRYADVQILMIVDKNYYWIDAMYDGISSCDNDFGGPLISDNILIGVSNYTEDITCLNGRSYFVSVPYYLDWIKTAIGLNYK